MCVWCVCDRDTGVLCLIVRWIENQKAEHVSSVCVRVCTYVNAL